MPENPSWIFADSQPGESKTTNEAMPRFGGKGTPGETTFISVDGESLATTGEPGGLWDIVVPELADGEHEFEMYTLDHEGNRSDSLEWTEDVQADESARAFQRERNRQWEGEGQSQWRAQERELVPPRPITGGGAGQPMTDPAAGGAGSGAGQREATPGGGGSTAPAAAGLEKGNAGTVGRIG